MPGKQPAVMLKQSGHEKSEASCENIHPPASPFLAAAQDFFGQDSRNLKKTKARIESTVASCVIGRRFSVEEFGFLDIPIIHGLRGCFAVEG
jgi:hypothetical protein